MNHLEWGIFNGLSKKSRGHEVLASYAIICMNQIRMQISIALEIILTPSSGTGSG